MSQSFEPFRQCTSRLYTVLELESADLATTSLFKNYGYPRWPRMTIEEKRPIGQSLIEKVIVGKGEVDLSFSYLPDSGELRKSQQQRVR